MTYSIFIPSEGLVKTSRWTLQALALIGAVVVVALAGTLALHVIAWLCSALVVFIDVFRSACHEAFLATGSSSVSTVAAFIFLMLINIKFACLLFPSLPSFFKGNGARV